MAPLWGTFYQDQSSQQGTTQTQVWFHFKESLREECHLLSYSLTPHTYGQSCLLPLITFNSNFLHLLFILLQCLEDFTSGNSSFCTRDSWNQFCFTGEQSYNYVPDEALTSSLTYTLAISFSWLDLHGCNWLQIPTFVNQKHDTETAYHDLYTHFRQNLQCWLHVSNCHCRL